MEEFKRSTLFIPQKRELAIIGIVVVAFAVLFFLTISYRIIFVGYAILSLFIFISYLIMWLEGASKKECLKEPAKWPHVTIIIPSYNSRKTIFDSIAACKRMDYPGTFDIIVIDDGSQDGSYEMLQKVKGITLLRNEQNKGKAHSLNVALKHAKGEIVACIDSDTYPAKDCLRKAVKYFDDSKNVASVVVFVLVSNPKTLLQKIQEIEYWISFGFFFKTIATIDGLYVTPGPTAFYKKDVLVKIGGFDEQNLTEDMEIALRFQKEGYKIRACHETVVFTEVPDTLGKLFRQRLRWYRGGVMNVLKYIDLFFNPKYGDFGLFVLPTTLGSGFFAALFMAWTLMSWSTTLGEWIIPFAYNFNAGVDSVVSGLENGMYTTFQSAWILGLFSLSIWFFFLIKSFEIADTKLESKHIVPVICMLWFYPFFIGFVFMMSYIYELFGVKYSW